MQPRGETRRGEENGGQGGEHDPRQRPSRRGGPHRDRGPLGVGGRWRPWPPRRPRPAGQRGDQRDQQEDEVRSRGAAFPRRPRWSRSPEPRHSERSQRPATRREPPVGEEASPPGRHGDRDGVAPAHRGRHDPRRHVRRDQRLDAEEGGAAGRTAVEDSMEIRAGRRRPRRAKDEEPGERRDHRRHEHCHSSRHGGPGPRGNAAERLRTAQQPTDPSEHHAEEQRPGERIPVRWPHRADQLMGRTGEPTHRRDEGCDQADHGERKRHLRPVNGIGPGASRDVAGDRPAAQGEQRPDEERPEERGEGHCHGPAQTAPHSRSPAQLEGQRDAIEPEEQKAARPRHQARRRRPPADRPDAEDDRLGQRTDREDGGAAPRDGGAPPAGEAGEGAGRASPLPAVRGGSRLGLAAQAASASAMSSATSGGFRPTRTPAASNASALARAVPEEPVMIAPACPIRLPGGALNPAT